MEFTIEDDDSGYSPGVRKTAMPFGPVDPYDFDIDDAYPKKTAANALSTLGVATKKQGFRQQPKSSWKKGSDKVADEKDMTKRTGVTGKADYFLSKYRQPARRDDHPESSFDDTSVDISLSDSGVGSKGKSGPYTRQPTKQPTQRSPLASVASNFQITETLKSARNPSTEISSRTEVFGRVMNIADLLGGGLPSVQSDKVEEEALLPVEEEQIPEEYVPEEESQVVPYSIEPVHRGQQAPVTLSNQPIRTKAASPIAEYERDVSESGVAEVRDADTGYARSNSLYSMHYEEEGDFAPQADAKHSTEPSRNAPTAGRTQIERHVEPQKRVAPPRDDYSFDFESTQNASTAFLTSPIPSQQRVVATRKDIGVQTDDMHSVWNPAASTPAPYPQGGVPPAYPGYPPYYFGYPYPPYPPQPMPFAGYPMPMHPYMHPAASCYGIPVSPPMHHMPHTSAGAASATYLRAFAESLNRLETADSNHAVPEDAPPSRRTSFSTQTTSEGAGRTIGKQTFAMHGNPLHPPSMSVPPPPVPAGLTGHPSVAKALAKYKAAMSASDALFERQLQQLRESLEKTRMQQTASISTAPSFSYTPTLAETKAQLQSMRAALHSGTA